MNETLWKRFSPHFPSKLFKSNIFLFFTCIQTHFKNRLGENQKVTFDSPFLRLTVNVGEAQKPVVEKKIIIQLSNRALFLEHNYQGE